MMVSTCARYSPLSSRSFFFVFEAVFSLTTPILSLSLSLFFRPFNFFYSHFDQLFYLHFYLHHFMRSHFGFIASILCVMSISYDSMPSQSWPSHYLFDPNEFIACIISQKLSTINGTFKMAYAANCSHIFFALLFLRTIWLSISFFLSSVVSFPIEERENVNCRCPLK